MTDIIKLLKDNLARFAHMSDDMPSAAITIGLVHFECLQDDGGWYGDFSVRSDGFQPDCRYRLKADYVEKPEIDEHTIICSVLEDDECPLFVRRQK